jgi:hypothetical protein
MQELQTEFDKLDLNGADKPRQTRFLRSQQDLKQKMEQAQASTTVSASVAVEDVNVESIEKRRILQSQMLNEVEFTFSARRFRSIRDDGTSEHSRSTAERFLR